MIIARRPGRIGAEAGANLTDRDITGCAATAGCDPARTKVRDVMTADALFCYLDQDVAEAARLMQQGQVRRLAVLDRIMR